MAPSHRALVLTPVAPHHLCDRTLVLRPSSEVRIELATLHEGMAVRATASPHPARLVTFTRRNFLDILKTKFGLNDR